MVDLIPQRCAHPGGSRRAQQRAEGEITPPSHGHCVQVPCQPGQHDGWQRLPRHAKCRQQRQQGLVPGRIVLPVADLGDVVVPKTGGQITDRVGSPQSDPQFLQDIPQVDPYPFATLGQHSDEVRRVDTGLRQSGSQDFLARRLGEELADIAPVAQIILPDEHRHRWRVGPPRPAAGPVRAHHVDPVRQQ